uniref:Uncharacterized protein n=1 Tax=Acrobeloides nanus TaxID=290746 RepID=A0A914CTY1_9BILA
MVKKGRLGYRVLMQLVEIIQKQATHRIVDKQGCRLAWKPYQMDNQCWDVLDQPALAGMQMAVAQQT